MNWQRLYEHQDQVEMFRRSIVRGRLSHAYLFCGPAGIGKATFARMMAQALLCEQHDEAEFVACDNCNNCRRCLAGTHPDVLQVGLPAGKSSIPIAVFSGEKERRGREGLCYELSLRPMAGARRIAIIDDADFMNVESTNALLKTLEEPPAGCVIILISANLSGVLPTIRSRCQLMRFRPLTEASVARLLKEQQLIDHAADADSIAALANGSVATAIQLAEPALRGLRDQLYASLAQGSRMKPLDLAAELTDGLSEIGGGTAGQRQNANWLVNFAMEFFRQAIRGQADASARTEPQVAEFLTKTQPDYSLCGRLLERTCDAATHLGMNSPVPLVLEGLFFDLATILRR